jgi:CYTH domain-containing protein
MPQEIERKFLIQPDHVEQLLASAPDAWPSHIRQGYLHAQLPVVRLRLSQDPRLEATRAEFTVKGPRTGLACDEFEFDLVDVALARALQDALCPLRTEKVRYTLPCARTGLRVQLDVFSGALQGLVLAEVEYREDQDTRVTPPMLRGAIEVSQDARYTNLALAVAARDGVLPPFGAEVQP